MPEKAPENPAFSRENDTFVIGIGAATWDRFTVVPEFPSREGVTQALASAGQGGGPVATALCTLAALGHACTLLDVQGDDAVGDAILQELEAYGVRTGGIPRVPGASSAHAQILVRQGDGARHIFFSPSTAPELQLGPGFENSPSNSFSNAGRKLLHLNGRHEAAARKAVAVAREHGVNVSFDGGAGRYRESIRDLVLASQLRIVALDFALKFSGTEALQDAARALLSDAPELLVITDGLRGSWVWAQGHGREQNALHFHFHCPAFPVEDVVDTTGCGDVYHGAFLHGWLRGWPLQKTARFASLLAAQTARYLGGRTALRKCDFAELEAVAMAEAEKDDVSRR